MSDDRIVEGLASEAERMRAERDEVRDVASNLTTENLRLDARVAALERGIREHRDAHAPEALYTCGDDRRLWALLDDEVAP